MTLLLQALHCVRQYQMRRLSVPPLRSCVRVCSSLVWLLFSLAIFIFLELIPILSLDRFGSWCYSGTVELTSSLGLGDIPHVIPTLRMQQGKLDFMCDVAQVACSCSPLHPPTWKHRSVLSALSTGTSFAGVSRIEAQPRDAKSDIRDRDRWLCRVDLGGHCFVPP